MPNYPAGSTVNRTTGDITVRCCACGSRTVTINDIAWATTVEGRTPPSGLLRCAECQQYPPAVRVRWQQMDHDPLQGVYE